MQDESMNLVTNSVYIILLMAVVIVGGLILTNFRDVSTSTTAVTNETNAWTSDPTSISLENYPVFSGSETLYYKNNTSNASYVLTKTSDYTIDYEGGGVTLQCQ